MKITLGKLELLQSPLQSSSQKLGFLPERSEGLESLTIWDPDWLFWGRFIRWQHHRKNFYLDPGSPCFLKIASLSKKTWVPGRRLGKALLRKFFLITLLILVLLSTPADARFSLFFNELPTSKKPTSLHLSAIVYHDETHWTFWLDDRAIRPDSIPEGITLQTITPESVTLTLLTGETVTLRL